jgi:lysophospholipase L1-like esterase
MLGSNDSKPENWKGAEKFKEEYQNLLSSYINVENPPVVLLCTPPTAYFPVGVTEGLSNYDVQPLIIEEIADIVKDVANESGYALININDITDGRRELFGKDNVHPNNDGAAEIAEEVYKYIINL